MTLEATIIYYLQHQEEKGLVLLYDSYSPALYGVIFRIVKSQALAEDVLQESFFKIWHSFARYEAEKGRLFTWMVNIARNQAIDTIRSRAYRKGLKNQSLEIKHLPIPENRSSFEPAHIGLRELTYHLRGEQKTIIDLMYFEGFSQAEIAEQMAIPLGTVKTRARKAIQLLRKFFNQP
ncbi:RNA polymerase subunit sigma-70 [Adhaeribacter arboris]|uniref:RNA polymerase subunit sigma-70 n=1 Tax=Adhaeribacter arboris TaxID=2072846 RepID=A0A2T2YP20_9BACT|nr:RNA polymerase subunit sigma-70 [Adhaeribacter arboris]